MADRSTWFDRQPLAVGCVAWLFGMAGLVVSTMLVQTWLHRALGQWAVHQLYPPTEYGEVRILDKHGNLSNGKCLYGWWFLAWNFGSFLGSAPVFFGVGLLLSRIGILNDPRKKGGA